MQPDEHPTVMCGQRIGAVRQADLRQHRGVLIQLHQKGNTLQELR